MKEYLKINRPKISLILIFIFFITNILTVIFPELGGFVMLKPSNLIEPWNWYRFFTYPLYIGGLLTWLHVSIVIFLTGLIIENRIGKQNMIGLIVISSFIGGLMFIIINQDDLTNRAIVTPTMISWGYWSSAIVIGLKFWKELNNFEKIVIILCFLSIFGIISEDFGFTIGKISVIGTILILTVLRIKRNKNRLQPRL